LSGLSVDRELDDCPDFTLADSDFCSERTTAIRNSRQFSYVIGKALAAEDEDWDF